MEARSKHSPCGSDIPVRPAGSGANDMKRPSMQIGLGIALGAGIGLALALALGSGSAWLGIGIAIGVAIGAAMASRRADSSPREPIHNDKGCDFELGAKS